MIVDEVRDAPAKHHWMRIDYYDDVVPWHCAICGINQNDDNLDEECPGSRPVALHPLLQAAGAVAAARVRYAEAFLRFKLREGVTDGQAHQQALLETGDELTVLEARLFVAKEEARRGVEG